jgi:hypothetical protein
MNHTLSVVNELVSDVLVSRSKIASDDFDMPNPVLERVFDVLPALSEALKNPPDGKPIVLQDGALPMCFGEIRLKIIRLYLMILECGNTEMIEQIRTSQFFQTILDLFFTYANNNMCHGLVEKVLSFVMDSKDRSLHHELFVEANLIQRFTGSYEVNAKWVKDVRHNRLGYMGHVFRVCETLAIKLSVSDDLKEYVNLPEWDAFVTTTLTQEREARARVLGGRRPEGAGEQPWEQEHFPISGYQGQDDDDSDEDNDANDASQYRYPEGNGHVDPLNWQYNQDDSDSDDDDAGSFIRGESLAAKPDPTFDNSSSDSSDEDHDDFRPFGGKANGPDDSVVTGAGDSDSDSDSSADDVSPAAPAQPVAEVDPFAAPADDAPADVAPAAAVVDPFAATPAQADAFASDFQPSFSDSDSD